MWTGNQLCQEEEGWDPFSNTCVPIIIMHSVCLFETGSDVAQHGLELLLFRTSTSYLLGLHMCSAMLGLCGSQAVSMLGKYSTYWAISSAPIPSKFGSFFFFLKSRSNHHSITMGVKWSFLIHFMHQSWNGTVSTCWGPISLKGSWKSTCHLKCYFFHPSLHINLKFLKTLKRLWGITVVQCPYLLDVSYSFLEGNLPFTLLLRPETAF